MSSPYTLRIIGAVSNANRDAANAALEAAGFGPQTFSISVYAKSDTGFTTPLWWGCNWQMTPAQRAIARTALTSAGLLAGIRWRDLSDADPTIAEPRIDDYLDSFNLMRDTR